MKGRIAAWVLDNVPMPGWMAAWVFGLMIGRRPHKVDDAKKADGGET